MINSQKLEGIKERIVKAVSPEKIILFGSYARGNATGLKRSSTSPISLIDINKSNGGDI